ncbi:uncharacterized protein LOC118198491 [Stegodyphus dumicola]|uniref:uncharacterized protein LOC118198491 n=1 Tax=Stegodyphus dumicola TaxID=202533 RepID=UPI0015B1A654|nr:uncharacterized protein LOC118198491 [Stegodyphus dumicola]
MSTQYFPYFATLPNGPLPSNSARQWDYQAYPNQRMSTGVLCRPPFVERNLQLSPKIHTANAFLHIRICRRCCSLLVRGRTRAELEANSNEVCNLFYQQCNRQKLQVAEHKCQILLIAKKGGSLTRRPTIRINNRRIKIVRVLRYLGLYIDEKLTWMPHILNLRKRTAIIAQHFRMQRGFHWGINSHIQKALYLTVVEKMVSYGAAIWAFPMQGRKIRHLSALQRPFLLSITRAFRTTSTDALNILAGVLPLHLRIEEEAVTQQVHQLRLSLTYDYVTFSQEQFENKTSQLHIHPAIKGIGIHLTKNPAYVAPSGYISIYTDGSRIDEKVGSAFVVLSEQQQPLHQWQMQLSTENSVFQSEALAIHEAIRLRIIKSPKP